LVKRQAQVLARVPGRDGRSPEELVVHGVRRLKSARRRIADAVVVAIVRCTDGEDPGRPSDQPATDMASNRAPLLQNAALSAVEARDTVRPRIGKGTQPARAPHANEENYVR